MKSPFPGMDPYLEQYWRDIHARFIIYACDQLNSHLPDSLRCRVEERVVVEPEQGPGRNICPDVRLVERPGRRGGVAVLEPVAVGEPLIVAVPHEEAVETFLEVVDIASGKRVVTVIEFLSMANKLPGSAQTQYLQKRGELQQGKVNIVEIDLLRAGRRIQGLDESYVPRNARTAYRACVWRATKPDQYEFYAMPLREPLPGVRIPLRDTDTDVPLALQPLIEQCYRQGRYDDINYREPPAPPLEDEDAAWARERVAAHQQTSG